MGLPSLELDGKVAIITGSTKGIGYGMACGLAQAGADVVITSRHQNECNNIADEINKAYKAQTLALAVDVTKEEQILSKRPCGRDRSVKLLYRI
jgi:gluconate 5-dehydrogenase